MFAHPKEAPLASLGSASFLFWLSWCALLRFVVRVLKCGARHIPLSLSLIVTSRCLLYGSSLPAVIRRAALSHPDGRSFFLLSRSIPLLGREGQTRERWPRVHVIQTSRRYHMPATCTCCRVTRLVFFPFSVLRGKAAQLPSVALLLPRVILLPHRFHLVG